MTRLIETEIECHECDGTFKVKLDADKNGNHIVKCPKCDHEHCRVIENGRVTSTRWDSRNGRTWTYASSMSNYWTTSAASTGRYYMNSWSRTGTSGTDNYLGCEESYRSI